MPLPKLFPYIGCLPTHISPLQPPHFSHRLQEKHPSAKPAQGCRCSRAQAQWDEQQWDAGAAHLVWDSPHLTWSETPSSPPAASQERLAETDSSRSRADVRRSAASHLGHACFSLRVKGM